MMSRCFGIEPSAHQPIELTATGCAGMYQQKANKHSEARDDDEQIEQDYDFDQQRHAGNKDLRSKKNAIFPRPTNPESGLRPHRAQPA